MADRKEMNPHPYQDYLSFMRKLARKPRHDPEQAENWSGSQDNAEEVLEEHVSKYGWMF